MGYQFPLARWVMTCTTFTASRWVRALGVLGVAFALGFGAVASADPEAAPASTTTAAALATAPTRVSLSAGWVFVEAPVDHSGQKIETEVLDSLHDELLKVLASVLGKDGTVTTKSDAKVLVQVEVTDFHMRNQASRWMLGGLSGKDYITSKVSTVDPATNATLFTTDVKTATANQYKGQDSIAKSHGDDIAKALSAAK
jgi:hypothetical protein